MAAGLNDIYAIHGYYMTLLKRYLKSRNSKTIGGFDKCIQVLEFIDEMSNILINHRIQHPKNTSEYPPNYDADCNDLEETILNLLCSERIEPNFDLTLLTSMCPTADIDNNTIIGIQ